MEEPIYLLDNEELEWTSTGWLIKDKMEIALCTFKEDGNCRYCSQEFLQCSNSREFVPDVPYVLETVDDNF